MPHLLNVGNLKIQAAEVPVQLNRTLDFSYSVIEKKVLNRGTVYEDCLLLFLHGKYTS